LASRNAGRIGRFARNRHVDGDDHRAARGQRAIHRLLGEAVLSVPSPAVQIENGRKWSLPLRLVDPRHQHPADAVAPKLDLADGELETSAGIIGERASCPSGAGPECARRGQADRARGGNKLEDVTASESVFVHVCSPANSLVAATLGVKPLTG